ncbi:MAG: polysaccharide biosynthesis tyrosine autokinase [Pirellula sp.]
MDAIRPITEGQNPPPSVQQNSPTNPDFIKILIRWKWLPILGSIVGATVGFLYFGQLLPKYKAVAMVEVISPAREVPIHTSAFGGGIMPDVSSRNDELMVVQSTEVLNRAIEKGHLTEHRKLLGKSAEQIVKWLKKPKLLECKLGSNDINSDIIKISVTTEDAELSGDVVQAIVNGYEDFVTGNLRNYTKEATLALTKFSDKYEKNRREAKQGITQLQQKPNLLWKDGRPHDPVTDTVLAIKAQIIALEARQRKIESILTRVAEAKSRGDVTVDALLRMVEISTNDAGFQDDGADIRHQDRLAAGYASIERFEEDRIGPVRAQLNGLKSKQLGESHPSVVQVQTILSELEAQLEKKKAEYKSRSQEYGSNKTDAPTQEGRLTIACAALQETLHSIEHEKKECEVQVETNRKKMEENQSIISNYELSVLELKSVSGVADEISENLRRLAMGTDFGQRTVTRLDLPQIGTFDGPYWYQYIGIGGMLGFMAFSGLAYLLEMADRSYRNPDEIASDLGMPIIGHLPLATISRADRIDEKVDSSIVTLHKARAPISEAFRGIRTSLFFGCQQSGVKVIQVTSPIPGDGKSTIAANIAVSIAQSGRRVCVVDCDFRRPRVAKIFGLREDTGFVQVIGGKVELSQAIQQTTIPNLFALTCGRRPANPAELLSSEVFGDLIATLRNDFDFVIVDTPPMLAVSDPANVASHVDGVLLTIRLRRNLRPIATRAAQMLHAINANMIGVVVNGIGVGGNSYGYGGYRYDNYTGGRGGGYGKSGYGGYGYGSTYQYGGYYGGTNVGRDYYDDSIPKTVPKKALKS